MKTLLRYGPLLIGLGCASIKGTGGDSGGEGVDSIDVIGILITPDEVIVPVGTGVQLEATGLSADRNAVDLTDAVDWYSASPSVALISNDLESEGMLSGMDGGVTSVVAVFEGIESAPARITVTDAQLDSLSISPPSVIVAAGEQIQLTAEARFSDGASADASSQVRWITADASVVTLDGNGNLTGESSGNTTVHVEWAGVTSEPIDIQVVGSGSTGTVDLTISDVYATFDAESGMIAAWVDVENLGGGTAAAFWIDMWVNPSSTPGFGDWPDSYAECEYVGGGMISTVLVQAYTSSTNATHDLFIVVDSTDDISELSESNNTIWTETISGGGGAGDPNLVIDYFGGYSDEEEGLVIYWVDVTNETTSDAGGFYVDVFHNTTTEPEFSTPGDLYYRITELGAGQTEYVELITDDLCGYCDAWALIDTFDQVSETNESDNSEMTEITGI